MRRNFYNNPQAAPNKQLNKKERELKKMKTYKNTEPPQLSWGELADLTHITQVELFGFCTCEDGPKVYEDCTQDGLYPEHKRTEEWKKIERMVNNWRESSRRLLPGFYWGHNRGGFLMLIRLPFGYGLNLGTGFSGYWSLRTWEWSRYDYADHFTNLEELLDHTQERGK